MNYESLPLVDRAEVMVCGGGAAGAFAAIAAARQGADVLLIEQLGMLGGTATAGLVTPVMHSGIEGDPACSYLSRLVRDRMRALNAASADGRNFDPLILKAVLEELAVSSGVRLLYHTFISEVVTGDNKVKAAVIANKDGLGLVEGQVFIDTTGDGDVSVRAGAAYTKGNPETGLNQPMSLRYIIDNVNFTELKAFLDVLKSRTGLDKGANINPETSEFYAHCVKNKEVTLTPVFEEAVKNGDLNEEDHLYWQAFSIHGRQGSIAFNCPEFFVRIDGTSPSDLTLAQVEGKKGILRQLAFYRKYLKGFEKAHIADIAVIVGVRESREIQTDVVLKAEDLFSKRKFPDYICQSNYPIDVHGRVLSNTYLTDRPDDGKPWYDIPYRALLVKGFDNLLVAGRCIGADFAAQASVRVQQSARATGEAAGIAAAIAVKRQVNPRDLKGEDIRGEMIQKGAVFA